MNNFTHLASLNGHEESVISLLIIEETGHLISASSGGKINVWDYP